MRRCSLSAIGELLLFFCCCLCSNSSIHLRHASFHDKMEKHSLDEKSSAGDFGPDESRVMEMSNQLIAVLCFWNQVCSPFRQAPA